MSMMAQKSYHRLLLARLDGPRVVPYDESTSSRFRRLIHVDSSISPEASLHVCRRGAVDCPAGHSGPHNDAGGYLSVHRYSRGQRGVAVRWAFSRGDGE